MESHYKRLHVLLLEKLLDLSKQMRFFNLGHKLPQQQQQQKVPSGRVTSVMWVSVRPWWWHRTFQLKGGLWSSPSAVITHTNGPGFGKSRHILAWLGRCTGSILVVAAALPATGMRLGFPFETGMSQPLRKALENTVVIGKSGVKTETIRQLQSHGHIYSLP